MGTRHDIEDWPDAEFLVQFINEVEAETQAARTMFLNSKLHPENDNLSRILMVNNITEEIGKLSRCANKLMLLALADYKTSGEKDKWIKEGYHRIITTSSLLRRLAQLWEVMPDVQSSELTAYMPERDQVFSPGP